MIQLKSIARRPKSRAPMEQLEQVAVTVTAGVEGDGRGRPGKRQVTVLSEESWRQACEEMGIKLSWLLRRANLLVSGFEFLPTDVGRRLQIGEVILEITRETDPCQRMEQQQPGLYEALLPAWRGGVCCRVLQGGTIAVGQVISVSSG